MEQVKKDFSHSALWNDAGKAGLFLGGVSIVYSLLISLLSPSSPDQITVASLLAILRFVLWAAKFVLCIYLMKLFINKFAGDYNEIDRGRGFRFGAVTALLSSLLYSGYTLAAILIKGTEKLDEEFNLAISQYSSMLDANSLSMMETLSENLPIITFFSNLIWCFLFGVILSAIFSSKPSSGNPFEEQK